MPEEISVVIIDDHPLICQGFKSALAPYSDIVLVGVAENAKRGVALVKNVMPDITIIDVNLPDINGIELLQQITSDLWLETRAVMLTDMPDIEQIRQSMYNGAYGYCSKDMGIDEIVQTIRRAMDGIYRVGMVEFSKRCELNNWLTGKTSIQGIKFTRPRDFGISDREMQILRLMANGLTNQQIACYLNLSHGTVKNHISNILVKLNVCDRTQAVIFAISKGWARPSFREKEISVFFTEN